MEITLRFVKTTKQYQHYEIVGSDAVGQVYIQIARLALPPAQLMAVLPHRLLVQPPDGVAAETLSGGSQ